MTLFLSILGLLLNVFVVFLVGCSIPISNHEEISDPLGIIILIGSLIPYLMVALLLLWIVLKPVLELLINRNIISRTFNKLSSITRKLVILNIKNE